jgi:hypothetical protein
MTLPDLTIFLATYGGAIWIGWRSHSAWRAARRSRERQKINSILFR